MNAPRPVPVALIERLDRDGTVVRDDPVYAWPATLGRALDCDIVLDDPHVAPRHARLDDEAGTLLLQVEETINGARVGSRHYVGGARVELAAGDVWRLGTTRLRVRRAVDLLAPERPLTQQALAASALHAKHPADWASLAGWIVLVLAWMGWEQWLDGNPGGSTVPSLYAMLGASFGLAGWALLWSLASKLFQGRLLYLTHLRIALKYTVGWTLVTGLLPSLAFVTGIGLLSRVSDLLGVAVLCALVWAHLAVVLPGRRRMLGTGLATAFVVGVGLSAWLQHERSGSWFSEPYTAALLPPVLHLAPTSAPQALIDDARRLRAPLDQQVREDAEDAEDDSATAADEDGADDAN